MEEIKYFVSEVVEYNDGTKDSPAIYIKDDEEQALSLTYGDYAKWMKAENVKCVSVCCYTNDNRMLEYKCHERKAKVTK